MFRWLWQIFWRQWSAWYHVYLFYGLLLYSCLYWGGEIYFHLRICFCVLMVQVADPCCEVKIENDIFVSLIDIFSKLMFLWLYYFRCFILLRDHQRERHICFFFSDNGICRPNFPTFFAPLVDYGIHVFWINSKMEKSFLNTFCLITNHEAVR